MTDTLSADVKVTRDGTVVTICFICPTDEAAERFYANWMRQLAEGEVRFDFKPSQVQRSS